MNAFRIYLAAGGAALALAALPAAAQAACTTLTSSPTGLVIDYNPLAATDTVKTFTITQTNSCSGGRTMRHGIANHGYEGTLPSPAYTTTTQLDSPITVGPQGGTPINLSQGSRRSLMADFSTYGKNQSYTRNLVVTVPRGRTLTSKDKSFDLYIEGEERAPGGGGSGNPTETFYRVLPVTIRTVDAVSMSLPGAGAATTLDFGTLRTGDRKDVNVRINATTPFRVTMDSENNGVMALVGGAGTWSIPYETTLNGSSITENSPVSSPAPSGPVAGQATWNFRVTVGDTSNLRAGVYRDVITLKVIAL